MSRDERRGELTVAGQGEKRGEDSKRGEFTLVGPGEERRGRLTFVAGSFSTITSRIVPYGAKYARSFSGVVWKLMPPTKILLGECSSDALPALCGDRGGGDSVTLSRRWDARDARPSRPEVTWAGIGAGVDMTPNMPPPATSSGISPAGTHRGDGSERGHDTLSLSDVLHALTYHHPMAENGEKLIVCKRLCT